MNGEVARRKFAVVVLAAVVVGLVAFVGACTLVNETGWFIDEESEFGAQMTAVGPLIPPNWSSDEVILIFDEQGAPRMIDLNDDNAKLSDVIVGKRWEEIYPSISPDGTRMVFSTGRHETGEDNWEIGVSNLDGSEYRRLTRSRGHQYGSKWSPDGDYIAFFSSHYPPEGNYSYFPPYGLYIMTVNGSGPRRIVDSVRPAGPLAWSPDGRTIAFLGVDEYWPGGTHIYIVERDGSNLAKLAQSFSPPTWSPDGKSIAFLRTGNRDSLFVVNPDGSELR